MKIKASNNTSMSFSAEITQFEIKFNTINSSWVVEIFIFFSLFFFSQFLDLMRAGTVIIYLYASGFEKEKDLITFFILSQLARRVKID